MSGNRSVQAAQRRRAGPSNSEPSIPGRGPQPSINSAQMFANQARPGQGPNIPTGRLAGQQAAMQQQQSFKDQQTNKAPGQPKMTIAQAITLITLRLGAVETKLMNIPEEGRTIRIDSEGGEIDTGLLQDVLARLESLENRSASSSSSSLSSPEINLLKQQFETVKQTVVQGKGASTTLAKEITGLKTQIENLKRQLTETTELVTALQNLTMDNSQKILELTMGTNDETYEEFTTDLEDLQNGEIASADEEIIGTDLKQLIENELNA